MLNDIANAAHVTRAFSYETAFLNGIHGIFVLDHLINDSHSEMNAVRITFVYTDHILNVSKPIRQQTNHRQTYEMLPSGSKWYPS